MKMSFSLVVLALFAVSANAGDCLRVTQPQTIVQGYSQGFTGDCGGAAQVVAPAYTYTPTQALVVRPVVQAQSYGYAQQQAIVVRQNVVQHQAFVQRQVVQPVIVRQNVIQRQQVNNGGVGAIGVLRVVGNTLGAIIGR